jgi:hypothetical protein
MLLGLSSGDRPAEYPLFGIDFATRGERFRDAYDVYRTVTDEDFPTFRSERFGMAYGQVDLLPKPPFDRTPSIAIGRAQQSIEWIAENMDGFIAPAPAAENLPVFAGEWANLVRSVSGEQTFKPIGIAGYLDLAENRNEPFSACGPASGPDRSRLPSFWRRRGPLVSTTPRSIRRSAAGRMTS